MRVVGGELRAAPPEVDEVVWLPLGEARKVVTYERDAVLLERHPASD